ncbi:MAG: hypothetical protein ACI4GZ_02055 [Ruminococcus sp.]
MKNKNRTAAKASPESLMALAENAKTVNSYSSLGFTSQQIFLSRLASFEDEDEKRRKIEELTK